MVWREHEGLFLWCQVGVGLIWLLAAWVLWLR